MKRARGETLITFRSPSSCIMHGRVGEGRRAIHLSFAGRGARLRVSRHGKGASRQPRWQAGARGWGPSDAQSGHRRERPGREQDAKGADVCPHPTKARGPGPSCRRSPPCWPGWAGRSVSLPGAPTADRHGDVKTSGPIRPKHTWSLPAAAPGASPAQAVQTSAPTPHRAGGETEALA